MPNNPIQPFLDRQSTLILDGALATELERRGYDLNDPLWSAKILVEDREAIADVHRDYLYHGADCLISATYQATLTGFVSKGFTEQEATDLILDSVQLALEVRDRFWERPQNRRGRLKPIVAASVGPYGAYLANGAEYTGDYDLDKEGLVAWHRPRWALLNKTDADLFACETTPSYSELLAYLDLLQETPNRVAWISFTCPNGETISDGTPLEMCAKAVDRSDQVVAVGINCTAPQFLPAGIEAIQRHTTTPIVVYPNSGEIYDPANKVWVGTREAEAYGTAAREWRKLGAAVIGGCCRTTPKHIRAVAERLKQNAKGSYL